MVVASAPYPVPREFKMTSAASCESIAFCFRGRGCFTGAQAKQNDRFGANPTPPGKIYLVSTDVDINTNENMWHVVYDDGGGEDFSAQEMKWLGLWSARSPRTKTGGPAKWGAKATAAPVVAILSAAARCVNIGELKKSAQNDKNSTK
jgi:hypothetical protein